MIKNINEFYGRKLAALDGAIGHIKDFYFDDKTWVIRYLVADTGSWLAGRQVLLSPHAFGPPDPSGKTLPLSLTMEQIENSPSIEEHKPVSRQYEVDYYRYYGWPAYWTGGGLWGPGGYPMVTPPTRFEMDSKAPLHHRDDKHLQSTQSITGYALQTVDGAIGQVSGLMLDDKSWALRKIVAEAGHWYAGREILIAPSNVYRISYEESKVYVNLTKSEIERTPRNEMAGSMW